MAAGSFKGSVWQIVKAHRASYIDVRTGERRWRDVLAFEVSPVAVGLLIGVFDVRLRPGASVGLLTISGLLSAFLFGVMLQISDRAMNWADDHPERSDQTSEDADYLQELSANAGYASLVSIAAAAVFVVSSTVWHHPWPLRIASAVGLALGIHMVLTLCMVMKRVFGFTQMKLNAARTGGGSASSRASRRTAA